MAGGEASAGGAGSPSFNILVQYVREIEMVPVIEDVLRSISPDSQITREAISSDLGSWQRHFARIHIVHPLTAELSEELQPFAVVDACCLQDLALRGVPLPVQGMHILSPVLHGHDVIFIGLSQIKNMKQDINITQFKGYLKWLTTVLSGRYVDAVPKNARTLPDINVCLSIKGGLLQYFFSSNPHIASSFYIRPCAGTTSAQIAQPTFVKLRWLQHILEFEGQRKEIPLQSDLQNYELTSPSMRYMDQEFLFKYKPEPLLNILCTLIVRITQKASDTIELSLNDGQVQEINSLISVLEDKLGCKTPFVLVYIDSYASSGPGSIDAMRESGQFQAFELMRPANYIIKGVINYIYKENYEFLLRELEGYQQKAGIQGGNCTNNRAFLYTVSVKNETGHVAGAMKNARRTASLDIQNKITLGNNVAPHIKGCKCSVCMSKYCDCCLAITLDDENQGVAAITEIWRRNPEFLDTIFPPIPFSKLCECINKVEKEEGNIEYNKNKATAKENFEIESTTSLERLERCIGMLNEALKLPNNTLTMRPFVVGTPTAVGVESPHNYSTPILQGRNLSSPMHYKDPLTPLLVSSMAKQKRSQQMKTQAMIKMEDDRQIPKASTELSGNSSIQTSNKDSALIAASSNAKIRIQTTSSRGNKALSVNNTTIDNTIRPLDIDTFSIFSSPLIRFGSRIHSLLVYNRFLPSPLTYNYRDINSPDMYRMYTNLGHMSTEERRSRVDMELIKEEEREFGNYLESERFILFASTTFLDFIHHYPEMTTYLNIKMLIKLFNLSMKPRDKTLSVSVILSESIKANYPVVYFCQKVCEYKDWIISWNGRHHPDSDINVLVSSLCQCGEASETCEKVFYSSQLDGKNDKNPVSGLLYSPHDVILCPSKLESISSIDILTSLECIDSPAHENTNKESELVSEADAEMIEQIDEGDANEEPDGTIDDTAVSELVHIAEELCQDNFRNCSPQDSPNIIERKEFVGGLDSPPSPPLPGIGFTQVINEGEAMLNNSLFAHGYDDYTQCDEIF